MKSAKTAGILLCMAIGILASTNAMPGGEPQKYSLEQGGNLPVCRAFLDVLEAMKSDEIPGCNRREPSPAPGFSKLVRKKLSTEQLYTISERLIGFAEHSDSQYFEKRRAQTDEFCAQPAPPKVCEMIIQEKKSAIERGAKWLETYDRDFFQTSSAWRYEPELDIDNDGTQDPVLLLTRDRCGGENYKGVFEVSPTFAYIMDKKYESVDESRTRKIFGHPVQLWPAEVASEKFRYIGANLGIFVFKGKTYFYTYLNSLADLDNKRIADESLSTTLGIFMHEHGVTRSVCELRTTRK